MKEDFDPVNNPVSSTNRREFLGKLGKSALVPFLDKSAEVSAQRGAGQENSLYQRRAQASFQFRINCAKEDFQPIPPLFSRATNGDEAL